MKSEITEFPSVPFPDAGATPKTGTPQKRDDDPSPEGEETPVTESAGPGAADQWAGAAHTASLNASCLHAKGSGAAGDAHSLASQIHTACAGAMSAAGRPDEAAFHRDMASVHDNQSARLANSASAPM